MVWDLALGSQSGLPFSLAQQTREPTVCQALRGCEQGCWSWSWQSHVQDKAHRRARKTWTWRGGWQAVGRAAPGRAGVSRQNCARPAHLPAHLPPGVPRPPAPPTPLCPGCPARAWWSPAWMLRMRGCGKSSQASRGEVSVPRAQELSAGGGAGPGRWLQGPTLLLGDLWGGSHCHSLPASEGWTRSGTVNSAITPSHWVLFSGHTRVTEEVLVPPSSGHRC